MLPVNTPNFPKHSETNKNKEWISKYIKACWDDFSGINTHSFYSGRAKYASIKKHMIGTEDPLQYLKVLEVDTANRDKSWLKAFKEVLPIGPKYRRIVLSILNKSSWGIDIDAIDPTSIEEKTEYYSRNKTRIILKKAYAENGVDPSMVPDTEDNFSSEEDLDLYMEYSYKNRFAVEAQQAIKLILNNSGYEALRERMFEELFSSGFVGVKDYYDQNGDVKIDVVPAEEVIVSRCKKQDFSDALYLGRVHDLSFADIKALDINDEIGVEGFKKIDSILNGTTNAYLTNPSHETDYYENNRAQVLDIEFYSINKYIQEKGLDKNGNKTASRAKKIKNREGNEYSQRDYKVVYEGKWVIGTNIFFGCKLQTNMKRPKENLSDVVPSFHFEAPNMHNMETRSFAEDIIPVLKQIQLTWMKYQDSIVTAKKSGVLIEMGALENIALGKGGEQFTPMEAFKFYEKKGSLFYREKSDDGKMNNRAPITELKNGMGDDSLKYFNEIQNQISLLQQLTGLNEVTDGSTPNSRMLNGVAKLAAESSNNSIDFLRRSLRNLFTKQANSLIIRVQDTADRGKLSGYINALGKNSIEFFKLSPEVSLRELGLVVKDGATEIEKEDIRASLEIALESGQITIADKSFISNISDPKHQQAYLALKIEKNIKRAEETAEKNSRMNAEIQKESLGQAAEIKKNEVGMETEAKISLINAEKEANLEVVRAKGEIDIILKKMEVSGRVETANRLSNAKEYSTEVQVDGQIKTNREKIAGDKDKKKESKKEPELA